MRTLMSWLGIKNDKRGVTALEYGLIAGVLGVGIAAGFGILSTGLSTAFTNIVAKF